MPKNKKFLLIFLVSWSIIFSVLQAQEKKRNKSDEAKKKYQEGLAYHKSGKLLKALELYNNAIKLDERYWEPYISRARLYENLKLYEDAKRDYSRVIQLKPQSPDAWHMRGCFFLEMTNEFDNALNDFSRAIMIDPKFIIAYNMKAATFEKMGKIDLAIEEYERGIRVATQLVIINEKFKHPCSTLYNNCAFLYQFKDKIDKAIEYFSKAIFYRPNVSSYYISRALLKLKKGDITGYNKDIAKANEIKKRK